MVELILHISKIITDLSRPLKGQCPYDALLGPSQTTRFTGGFDLFGIISFMFGSITQLISQGICR